MNKERGLLNRKGDVTITTVILIVLGLAVLIFLIIGFTKGFDFFFGKFDDAPGSQLQTVAKACELAVEANLYVDFCSYRIVEISGKDQMINCMHPTILRSLGTAGIDVTKGPLLCDEEMTDVKVKTDACESLIPNKNDRADAKINGETETCGDLVDKAAKCVSESGQSKFDCKKLNAATDSKTCVFDKCGVALENGQACTGEVECSNVPQDRCIAGSGCKWQPATT